MNTYKLSCDLKNIQKHFDHIYHWQGTIFPDYPQLITTSILKAYSVPADSFLRDVLSEHSCGTVKWFAAFCYLSCKIFIESPLKFLEMFVHMKWRLITNKLGQGTLELLPYIYNTKNREIHNFHS